MTQLQPVDVYTSFQLIEPDGGSATAPVTLRYDPAEPYAVHFLFHFDDEIVPWTFARELLTVGLDEPAGIGDVRVWPWATSRGDFLALTLCSPDGNALYEIPRTVIARFLRRTYTVVPRGRETEHLDVDKALAQFFPAQ